MQLRVGIVSVSLIIVFIDHSVSRFDQICHFIYLKCRKWEEQKTQGQNCYFHLILLNFTYIYIIYFILTINKSGYSAIRIIVIRLEHAERLKHLALMGNRNYSTTIITYSSLLNLVNAPFVQICLGQVLLMQTRSSVITPTTRGRTNRVSYRYKQT